MLPLKGNSTLNNYPFFKLAWRGSSRREKRSKILPYICGCLAVFTLLPHQGAAQTTNVLLNPEADAFVREAAPTNNYGRAGSLSVSGIGATNGLGVPGGRADTLARFELNEIVAALDGTFGNHDWFIASAVLRLYELGAPNNALFNRGIGSFQIRWLPSGNNWLEGTGSPSAPTTDGVTFQDLPALLDPLHDASLGVFTNNGIDGPLTINLSLVPAFAANLRAGLLTTLQFTPANDSIGFTFLSRSDPRMTLRIGLELRVAAGPVPQITSVERTNLSEVALHFNLRSNWTCVVQYREALPAGAALPWVDLPSQPAQGFEGQATILDATTNEARLYRLSVSLP